MRCAPHQRSLRATAPLPGGQLLGLLAGHVLTADEWDALKWGPAAGGGEKQAHGGGSAWLAREMALESYCVELNVPSTKGEEGEKLFLSSFGYGAPAACATQPASRRADSRSGGQQRISCLL